MYCDALTVAAVANELRRELLGGRIQQVLLVDRYALGLEVYARRRQYLLISARPDEGGRIHLATQKLRRGVEVPTPLLLRLRKDVEGGRLVDIQQPPWERVLRLSVEGPEGMRVLVVEIMGQRSNIVLLEEDSTILECARRVPATHNRYRVVLPGRPYVPPPPQSKANGLSLTAARLQDLLAVQDPDLLLWQRLVATVFAVSPLLAREVAFRASGDARCAVANPQSVLQHLQGLLGLVTSQQWQPTLALEEEGKAIAYAPYVLTQYPQREARASISEAMATFYEQHVGEDAYAVAKARVQGLIDRQRERQSHKREALLAERPTPEALEELRRNGEWLLAYAHEVKPRQSELAVSWSEEEAPIRIPLDPGLSAIENAREYFKRYDKAKGAAAEVPELLARVDGELAYLDQLSTDLALAEGRPGIAAVESALTEAFGTLPGAQAGRAPPARKVGRSVAEPLHVLSPEGFSILVGRNSWQNEQVTFRHSAAHDVWLHARDVHGAHVLIRSEGREVPESVLRLAAELAAYYSAARQDNRVQVDYTLRKNVRRLKSGKQGQVVYMGQKTLGVQPRGPAEIG